VVAGDFKSESVMAGQSVGMVTREQSTQEVIDEFLAQALAVLVQRMTDGQSRAVQPEADGVADTVV